MSMYALLRAALLGAWIAAGLAACAPNTVREPLKPDASGTASEVERYDTLIRLASASRANRDPRSAVQLYQQAIETDGDRPEAYVLLAETLNELEAFDDAARLFEQAIERNPEDLRARRGYGRVLLALKRPEGAIVQYRRVVDAAPGDTQALNGLGVAYDLAGRHGAAQGVYRRGLTIVPDSLSLRNNLGLSLALDGQYDEAIAILGALADEPGAQSRNRQNLALAYGLSGDLVTAEKISRLDLDEEAVANNLAYFAALAAVENQRARSAALGVNASDGSGDPVDLDANRRLAAIVLDGGGLELGLASSGRWFVDLGDYPSAQLSAGAWRSLQNRHADVLSGLDRFAGSDDGPQPLLAGPLATARQAQALCNDLSGRGVSCEPMPL